MNMIRTLVALIVLSILVGCGAGQGRDLSKEEAQQPANLEAGKNAKSIDEWAKANPNNGAPGSGETGDK